MTLRSAHVPELAAWLADTRHVADDGPTLLSELAHELRSRGLPLWRASLALTTKHPEVFWRNVQWREDRGIEVFLRPHEDLDLRAGIRLRWWAPRGGRANRRPQVIS